MAIFIEKDKTHQNKLNKIQRLLSRQIIVCPPPRGVAVTYLHSTKRRPRMRTNYFQSFRRKGGFLSSPSSLHPLLHSYSNLIMDLDSGTYEPGFVGIRFCQEWWVSMSLLNCFIRMLLIWSVFVLMARAALMSLSLSSQ